MDLEAKELRRNGVLLNLQQQPFQILELLVTRAGQLVARQEIQEKLWPHSFVCFNRSINTGVSKLRQTLGDSLRHPRYIETRSRRGYRFLAPVEPVGRATTPSAQPEERINSIADVSWASSSSTPFQCGHPIWRFDPDPNGFAQRESPLMEKVNVEETFARISEYWRPHRAAELNGQHVKLVKFLGPFVWHHHENEDELILVIKGRMLMEFRDRTVAVDEGEFIVVPRGVDHRPVAEQEVHAILLEKASTPNTGNAQNGVTLRELQRV